MAKTLTKPQIIGKAIGSNDYIVQISPEQYDLHFSSPQKQYSNEQDVAFEGDFDDAMDYLFVKKREHVH